MNFCGLVFILTSLALTGLWSGGQFQGRLSDCRVAESAIWARDTLMVHLGSAAGRPAGISRAAVFESSPSALPRRGQGPGRPNPDRPNRNQSEDSGYFKSSGGDSLNLADLQDYQSALAGAVGWPMMTSSGFGVVSRFELRESPLMAVDRLHKFLVWLRSLLPLADHSSTLPDGEGNLFV